jgi:hypothetical protein
MKIAGAVDNLLGCGAVIIFFMFGLKGFEERFDVIEHAFLNVVGCLCVSGG